MITICSHPVAASVHADHTPFPNLRATALAELSTGSCDGSGPHYPSGTPLTTHCPGNAEGSFSPGECRFVLSCHAIQRARERCGWSANSLTRMVDRVFAFGAQPSDCPAQVKSWISAIQHRYPDRTFRLHGRHLFVFYRGRSELTMLTVLHLPRHLAKIFHRRRPARFLRALMRPGQDAISSEGAFYELGEAA
jgi:hypothetical protein